MKDPRDGQTYKTVVIDDQEWMAENLNYQTNNSYCYDDNSANCAKYGRLYEWEEALNACPEGWHLATNEDFEILLANVGEKTASKVLKSITGWRDDDGERGNGLDAFGFNALPAGHRNFDGYFYYAGEYAYFWSATELSEGSAYVLDLGYDHDSAYLNLSYKDSAYSVRCLRD